MTRILPRVLASLILVAGAVPATAWADGLTFNRQSTNTRSGFTVTRASGNATIEFNHVCNYQGFSQPVYMQIWYTTDSNPAGNGYVGSSYSIGTLNNNSCFLDVTRTSSHTNPPSGSYYVHLIVGDTSGVPTIEDYLTATTLATFGSGGSSGGGSGGGGGGGGGGSASDGGGGALDAWTLALLALMSLFLLRAKGWKVRFTGLRHNSRS